MRIRGESSPTTIRPFKPDFFLSEPSEQMAEALDHVAHAMASIDHNIDMLLRHAQRQTELLEALVNAQTETADRAISPQGIGRGPTLRAIGS